MCLEHVFSYTVVLKHTLRDVIDTLLGGLQYVPGTCVQLYSGVKAYVA